MGRRKMAKNYTPKERAVELRKLAAMEKKLLAQQEALESSDPFWFFKPTDGVINEAQKVFLGKYLSADDIPERIDGQMDVFGSEAEIVGAGGGNQSGKSTVGAIFAYTYALGEIPDGLKGVFPEGQLIKKTPRAIRVIGVDYKTMMNTLIPTYQKWAPRGHLKGGRWANSFSSEQKKLFLYERASGGDVIATIEFMTNQQDVESFQGPPLDVVIFDEEPKQDVFKENLLRFVTADRLKMIFCWTPTKGLTWTYDMFVGEKGLGSHSVDFFKLCSVSNPKASLEALDSIIAEISDYQERKMRLLGEFISLSGLVYGRLFDSRTHVIPPFFENLGPHDKEKYLCITGLDPHMVTPSAMTFVLVDREGIVYVDRCFSGDVDTEELKAAYWGIVKGNGYRAGWAVADKSSDSSIVAFGGRNIFRELKMGEGAIPALRTSVKFEGSIKAGVDEIKKRLKAGTFYIVDRPENKELIKSFRTLERETYANEDVKGQKDRISEGRHHHHAAMRYIFQFPVNYYDPQKAAPQPKMYDPAACY